MNDIDYEIANPDPTGTIASLSSLDVPSELDADWNVDVREPTVVPPIAVRGHLRRIGVAACRLAPGTLRHQGRTTARTRGADFFYAWTVARDNRQLSYSGEPGTSPRATGARRGADSSALGAET
jgi:hypothetical protein